MYYTQYKPWLYRYTLLYLAAFPNIEYLEFGDKSIRLPFHAYGVARGAGNLKTLRTILKVSIVVVNVMRILELFLFKFKHFDKSLILTLSAMFRPLSNQTNGAGQNQPTLLNLNLSPM